MGGYVSEIGIEVKMRIAAITLPSYPTFLGLVKVALG
jgi:hypothetical protein